MQSKYHMVRVPDELYSRIKAQADYEGRSVNNMVLTLLMRAMREEV